MTKFSERYGYVKPVEALKRGCLDDEGAMALCNCFDYLDKWLNNFDADRHAAYYDESYTALEETIWCFFMNQRRDSFYGYSSHKVVATEFLLSTEYEWFHKFDMIEFSIKTLRKINRRDGIYLQIVNKFIEMINSTFKRLNYAYRVVDDLITEITDDEEIKVIEEALTKTSSIQTHLSDALKHLSNKPTPDYRNSIKESITAVEALCRKIKGESTLGDALKKLEKNGVKIPKFLQSGFEKLYVYTNDPKTGIRHALMDDSEAPQFAEAKFMLVACSAFVNYIQEKRS